ncbi:MAG: Gfo/Idh/MocA family oxidoreductase [Armatimonadetes bacterium]|nr:Gfo/Idh/MocA family oxidoreductase [Armatimonadota bacterium]
MSKPTLTVGFVGAGGNARHHLAGCVHSGLVRRAVLVEPEADERARLRQRYGLIKADTAELDPLLADDDVTVVDVCGPVAGRAEAARRALAAGKHVILDAPPAQSVAELDELAALAEAQGRLLLCALSPLHMPAHRKLQELLRREPLPPPVHATALTVLAPDAPADDLPVAAYEAIVALQHVLGPAVGVKSALVGEASVSALLELGDGVAAQISVLRSPVGERPWGERRLFTTEGMILLRDNPEDELPLILAHGDDYAPVKVKAPPDVYEYAAVHCMEHLLDCMLSEQPEPAVWDEARAARATWEAAMGAAGATV